ncbi:MAG: alpha/beta fold hydrolase [Nanoarchaeota archaeon]
MKLFIRNRSGKRIAVLVDKPKKVRGLAFVMHGRGGFKEQPQVLTFARACFAAGCIVVRFDARHSLGESEGRMEEITVKSCDEDLEDVILWAKKQTWYVQPFFLVGHSLGGLTVLQYAQSHPNTVAGVAPLATVLSGKRHTEVKGKSYMSSWKSTGWLFEKSLSKPGVIKRIPWSFMEELMRVDVTKQVKKLTMPVLLIVGENDEDHVQDQKNLYRMLPGPKEFHIIKGAPHTFRDRKHLAEIKRIMKKWIDNVLHHAP